MSAVESVLNLPELLEAILLRTDSRTVLLSQRVSKQFKATIDDSIKVQEKFYFRRPHTNPAQTCRPSTREVNALLPVVSVRGAQKGFLEWSLVRARFEEVFGFFVQVEQDASLLEGPEGEASWRLTVDLRGAQWRGKGSTEKQSWRRMLVLRDEHCVRSFSTKWWGHRIMDSRQGLLGGADPQRQQGEARTMPMGDLLDEAIEVLEEHIRWHG